MVTLPAYIEEPPRQPLTLAAGLRRVVSFPILLGALLVAGGFSVAKLNILDPDTWWHIAVGQRILLTHSWPRIELVFVNSSWDAVDGLRMVGRSGHGRRGITGRPLVIDTPVGGPGPQ